MRRSAIGVVWRPIFAVVVLLALIYGHKLVGRLTANGRIAPAVAEAAQRQRYVDVQVRLDFPPEDFHLKYFQRIGTMSGVEGNTVRLRRVPAAGIHEMAGIYWIRTIEPLVSR